jgi:hypothetical protein
MFLAEPVVLKVGVAVVTQIKNSENLLFFFWNNLETQKGLHRLMEFEKV